MIGLIVDQERSSAYRPPASRSIVAVLSSEGEAAALVDALERSDVRVTSPIAIFEGDDFTKTDIEPAL